jgi:superfamily II DNA helicase RecQ
VLETSKLADWLVQKMQELKYHVIVIQTPELLIDDPQFWELFKFTKFTSKLFNVMFDEGHCISQWGSDDFRPEYKKIKLLQWQAPNHPVSLVRANKS